MNLKKFIKQLSRKSVKSRSNAGIREISYAKLKELMTQDIEILDIRSPQEYAENRIRYAINIPLYELNRDAEKMLPDKNKLIVVYCGYGERSKKAYKILANKGYTNIYSLKGGIEGVISSL